MPNFLEDPSVLTKDKLKSELLANSVALPQGDQRKDVYVQLYKRHLSARNSKASSGASRDFSSDEEREATLRRPGRPKKATKKTDKSTPDEADDFDVNELSNEDLKEELLKYGLNPGPIMGSTRKVYEKRLLKLKEQGAEVSPPAAVSSTAEESKQNGDDSDQYSDDDDPEIILKLEKREPLKKTHANLRQTIIEQNQTMEDVTEIAEIPEQMLERLNRPRIKTFPQEVNLDRNDTKFSEDTETSWTSGSTRTGTLQTSARETPVWRRTTRKRVGAAEPFDDAVISGNLPIADPLASSNQTFAYSEYEKYETQQVGNKVTGNFKHSAPLLSSGDFSGLPRRTPKKTLIHEEVLEKISTDERKFDKDVLKEMFPYAASTPTGISVSCRRPIKGAAGRPVPLSEYKMDESYSAKYIPNYTGLADVKSQPAKKGRSLPVWIKILLFVLVAVFLFLVYQVMETNEVNPFPHPPK